MPDERVRRPVHPPIDIEKIQPSPRALRMRQGSTLDCPRQQNLHATRSPIALAGETLRFFPTHPFLIHPYYAEEDGKNCAGARCYRPSLWPVLSPEKKLADLSTCLHAPSRTCDPNSSRSPGIFQSTERRREDTGRGDPSRRLFAPTRQHASLSMLPLYLRVESLRPVTAGEDARVPRWKTGKFGG